MRRIVFVFAVFFAVCSHMTLPAGAAQDQTQATPVTNANAWTWDARAEGDSFVVRRDTPSGLPVPRFVSLKSAKTFCRVGPSFSHPVRITYMRQGLPLVVVAETRDHWRKLRDRDGDECWTHRSKLSGAETALVIEDGLTIRARPNANAAARARLGEGLIARIEEHRDGWIKITADNVRGWVPESGLWGASQRDAFAAAPN